MKAEISTLIYAPATIAPESQPTAAPTHNTGGATTVNEGKVGEYTKAEVSDTAENNTITQ